jgi:carbonic anhydrase/acetyltransferase-like protein (isoleucine patch superfamily)
MTQPKYELTDETKVVDGTTVHRVRYLREISTNGWGVRPGDLGGFVESTSNLEQRGTSLVLYDAVVMGSARVLRGSVVTDKAIVGGHAIITDVSSVEEEARVIGRPRISHSKIAGSTVIHGNPVIEHTRLAPRWGNSPLISRSIRNPAPERLVIAYIS